MDNPAPHDFQLRYYNGIKVEYSPGAANLSIRKPDGSGERLDPRNIEKIRSLSDRVMVRECLLLYQRCCQEAERIAPQKDRLSLPHIIRESSVNNGEITAPQISNLISASMATMTSVPRIPDTERSFEYAYKTFLPEVGWCLASPAEQFLLLFTDGQTVLIDGRKNRVAFHDRIAPTPARWLDIDQALPAGLKAKLAYFPKFVNLLKAGHGHSFVH
jgi:hypothetical protein